MNDGVLVEALRARDPGALAALYDTYAESIYRYCRMMLGCPDSAQVALRDTLIAAEALVGALADPESFRPWLYALARGECLRRRTPGDSVGDHPGDQADDRAGTAPPSPSTVPFGTEPFGAEHSSGSTGYAEVEADLRLVAQGAVSALSPEDREILELVTRHDLSMAELAAVYGTGQRYVEGLRESATDRLRDRITVEILARKSLHSCERAGRLLAGFSGTLKPEVRQRMIKHLARCDTCSRHRVRQISPAKVFGQLPEPGLPDTLRVRVLSCFVDPELVPYRRFVAKRVGVLDPSGFPRAGARREGRLAQAVAGAVATVAAAAALALVFAQFSGEASDPVADDVTRRWPVAGGTTAGPAPSTARPDHTPADEEPAARQRTHQPPVDRVDFAGRVVPVIPAGPVPLPTPAPRPIPPRSVPSSRPSATPTTTPSGSPTGKPPVTSPGDDIESPSPSTTPRWPGHRPPFHRSGPWPGHGSWPGRHYQHHRRPRPSCGRSPRPEPWCPSKPPTKQPSKTPSATRPKHPSTAPPRTPSTGPQRRKPHRWPGPDGDGDGRRDRTGHRGPHRYDDGTSGEVPRPRSTPEHPPMPTPRPSPPESSDDA